MPSDNLDDTGVIRTEEDDGVDLPMMSYTAVSSHPAMAEAFVNQIIRLANQMVSDHELTALELMKICQFSLSRRESSRSVEQGRHLRRRIKEQISRADRYREPFSMIAFRLDNVGPQSEYDSIVDTIFERVRQTDLIFLFKTRVLLILPHTVKESRDVLRKRIYQLLETTLAEHAVIEYDEMTYPDPRFKKGTEVLDWSEDQLRT